MTPNFRKHLGWGTAALVFGLFLIHFGFRLKLFTGEGSGVAITIFALAWLTTVALLGLYFKEKTA